MFEKRHADVLQDIDRLLEGLEAAPSNHGGNLHHEYFQEVSTPHPTVPGRSDRSFDMNRDGFSLLVMGYTGHKALDFKLAYIRRFNEMEEALRVPVVPALGPHCAGGP